MDKKFDGMRDLMDAEERASKIVNEARQERQQKMASARDAAELEIAAHRQTKEAAFQRLRAERLGDPEEQRRTLSAKADEDVVEMRKTFEEAKEGVIKQLVEAVARTEVTIPESWEMRMKLSKSA